MNDQWIDRLSEYLDDELGVDQRRALEAHLAHCVECTTTLGELRAVAVRARSLENRTPSRDLWPEIAARIAGLDSAPDQAKIFGRPRGMSRPRFTLIFTLPQLAAAAVVLMLLSGSMMWLVGSRRPIDAPGNSPEGMPRADTAIQPVSFADAQYDAAIADLQRALAQERDQLDPATVQILEKNLATIDKAIDEARRALRQDPANTYLNNHLVDARRRKLALLRIATALPDSGM
jgi:tetratricopeptide (TPR) repeat protein